MPKEFKAFIKGQAVKKIIDPKTFWVTSEDESNSSSARLMKVKLQI